MDIQPTTSREELVSELVNGDFSVVEVEGGSKTGKTALIEQVIAGIVEKTPEVPGPAVVLFAGDREISAARERWAGVPQVLVQGRLSEAEAAKHGSVYDSDWGDLFADLTSERFNPNANVAAEHPAPPMLAPSDVTVLFDDWFTEEDGSLRLYDDQEALAQNQHAYERTEVTNFVPPLQHNSGVRIIAALRPGHTSQLTPDYRDDGEEDRLTVRNVFSATLYGDYPPNASLIPDPGSESGWMSGLVPDEPLHESSDGSATGPSIWSE